MILPEHLRGTALVAGGDFGWPLDEASDVIQALADAGAVIVGVEAWSVDSAGVPASVGWSSYDLDDYAGDWEASVTASKVEAERVLAGVMETAVEDEVNYIGIDWDTPGEGEPEPE
ncbi:MAG: hypothetical protein A2133_02350 [Actinobacteria bacterium RBG_16_64_13]|nr:MAG: hypothetical protein A2133_02350 [Actinobacteria bacterium RBG_16_64_13]